MAPALMQNAQLCAIATNQSYRIKTSRTNDILLAHEPTCYQTSMSTVNKSAPWVALALYIAMSGPRNRTVTAVGEG